VTTAKLADLSVTMAKLADASVSTSKLQDSSVTNAKIANDAVNSAKIQDGTVTGADIQDGGVGTADIANLAVTNAKINDVTWTKITGRPQVSCPAGQKLVTIAADGSTACAIEDDPQVGAVNNGQWCQGDGSAVQCNQPSPIPSGFCLISFTQGSCPAGYSRYGGADGRALFGASSPGGTGGSATHQHGAGTYSVGAHTHSISMDTHNHKWYQWESSGLNYGFASNGINLVQIVGGGAKTTLGLMGRTTEADAWNHVTDLYTNNYAHNHGGTTGAAAGGGLSGSSDSQSNLPPYINVLICCKN